MISRINRTERRRILKGDVDLRLREAERSQAPIFDLHMRLDGYEFPALARVHVEAWRGNASQRWEYGTVGSLTPPSDEQRRLSAVPAGARFRVFVVASDGSGRLLGHATNLMPQLPLNSLLPLEERDLGAEVWRLEFDDEDANPVLLVNSAITGISETVRHDTTFRSLVMPEVFRSILTRMVLLDRPDLDDPDHPWADWADLARHYLPNVEPVQLPPNERADPGMVSRARAWIDDVVRAMAKGPLDAANAYQRERT